MSLEEQTPSMAWTIGSLARTRVRVSYLFLPFAIALMVQLGWQVGLLVAIIFFFSALLHECGHVAFARWTGGWTNEIIVWPLGGFETVTSGRSSWSRTAGPWIGPLINLWICFCALFGQDLSSLAAAFNALVFPAVNWNLLASVDVMRIIVYVNWMMFLANILPIRPLDGWALIKLIENRLSISQKSLLEVIAVSSAIAISFLGLCIQQPWLVVFGFFLGCFHASQGFSRLAEWQRDVDDESQEESYYEGAEEAHDQEHSSGQFWANWSEQRQREHEELMAKRREEDEAMLDRVLAKVHQNGMASLNRAERKLLQRVSEAYRTKEFDQ